jgi:hypothetical protein
MGDFMEIKFTKEISMSNYNQTDDDTVDALRKLVEHRKSLGFTPEKVITEIPDQNATKCPCDFFRTTARPSESGPSNWMLSTCIRTGCRYEADKKAWICEYSCWTEKVSILDL